MMTSPTWASSSRTALQEKWAPSQAVASHVTQQMAMQQLELLLEAGSSSNSSSRLRSPMVAAMLQQQQQALLQVKASCRPNHHA
jgi:hypothetical protein